MFSKKKLSISELVKILIENSLGGGLAQDEKFFIEELGNEDLNDSQFIELLIFNMFAHAKSISDILNDHKMSTMVLDYLHAQIYKDIAKLPLELEEFNVFIQNRYTEYYKYFDITNTEDSTINIGRVLSANIFGKNFDVDKSVKIGLHAMNRLITLAKTIKFLKDNYVITVNESNL